MSANPFDLSQKTVLLTGGTRGIGRAMAIALAEAGADIILVQRDNINTATYDAIKALGRDVQLAICDLSSSPAVNALIPSILSSQVLLPNRRIDILVNAAGIQRRHPAAEFPTAEWDEVIQTNLSTTFALCRDVGKFWLENGIRGRIVNVASLLSFQGGLTVPAYSAAKAGVVAVTKALSNEWAGKGIGVNAIAPGYVATDMNEALIADPVRSRQIMERIPAARWGKPEDFGGPVVFLASEKASAYVNGECLVVDGGWMGR